MSEELRTLCVTATVNDHVDTEGMDEQDVGVEGEYSFEVDASLSDAEAASAVLDEFSETVPLSEPEHFSLSVTDEHGNELNEDSDHEPYSATRPRPC